MSFLPIDHPDQARVDVLFQILDSVLQPRSCAYVAGPLNSGRTYYEYLAAGEQHPPIRARNESRLRDFALKLRKRLAYPVFDSGLLKIPDWSGRQYDLFFLDVISRYARDCWFLAGWEFSTGATKEFLFCCTRQIPCFSESGETLTISEGMHLISVAADFVRSLNLDDEKLRSRVADLRRLAGAKKE
jgi:hypothetical protein